MALDIYQTVTDRIVAVLEQGQLEPYKCPWRQGRGGLPRNALTGKDYRGVNVLGLWAAERHAGYDDNRWGTYRQWAELKAQVKKGERGSLVVFYKDFAVEGENGAEETRMVIRSSWAFNADQVDGAPISPDVVVTPSVEAVVPPVFEAMTAGTGAMILTRGNQPCYDPNTDEVHMPTVERFDTVDGYCSVLAHELVHWTGASSRLARDFTGRFNSASYAAEELVAELGAAFTMASLGLASEPHPQHATYIASWITLLKKDKRAIFTAASAASKAVDLLIPKTG